MKNLKALLTRREIKQVDLVKSLKIDPARVSMQINGIRELPEKHQLKLAQILNIDVADLKFDEPVKGKK